MGGSRLTRRGFAALAFSWGLVGAGTEREFEVVLESNVRVRLRDGVQLGRLDHGGRWRSERDWPIPDQKLTPYYLSATGRLSRGLPAVGADPMTYDFDPGHPVPTMGGTVTSGEPLMRGGGFDQREGPEFYGSRPPYLPVAARPDVLVFDSIFPRVTSFTSM